MAGIQVNHCKNPKCANFGVPPKPVVTRGKGGVPDGMEGPGDYTVVATGKDLPALRCRLCSEVTPMQSNLALAEELLRISSYLEPVLPRCPNLQCDLSRSPAVASNVTRTGTSPHGVPRFRCIGCRKTFTFGGSATKRQRRSDLNTDILVHLMNAMPLRRIIKVLEISPSQLYDRIDFFYEQAQRFAGERERTLMELDRLETRYLSVDRQKLTVNWHSRRERKNTVLLSIGTADQTTGYIFALNVNFDPSLDPETVEADMLKVGDDSLPRAFRRYARVWTEADWQVAAVNATSRTKSSASQLESAVAVTYATALARSDIEDGDIPTNASRTPAKGMLLHEQVVMYAHIQLVSRLLSKARKLRFFTDQESGIRAAILTAVPNRVVDRTADAFYVRVQKEMTIDKKRSLVGATRRRLKTVSESRGITLQEAELLLAQEELGRMVSIGKWGDRWFRHPVSDMREPEKLVCWLTDIDPVETDPEKRADQLRRQARLHLKATLTGIDRFFMQVRRSLTLAERAVSSSNSDGRRWFGKSAYNPDVLVKVLAIFRVYFNYCEVGEDGKTPAMRLGLADSPVTPDELIRFEPKAPDRRRAVPKKTNPLAQKREGVVSADLS